MYFHSHYIENKSFMQDILIGIQTVAPWWKLLPMVWVKVRVSFRVGGGSNQTIVPEENCPPPPPLGLGFGLGLVLRLRGNFPWGQLA